MQTRIRKQKEFVVISIGGKVDHETQDPMKERLKEVLISTTDTVPKQIIVDMENLQFVGSSGISQFVQALKDFNTRAPIKPQYCNVSSEFRKIFKAFDDENVFEYFENDKPSKTGFDN